MRPSRRDIIASGLTTCGAALGMGRRPAFAETGLATRQSAVPPSERVNVAVLGCGRGSQLAQWFTQLPESQVVAICDVDERRSDELCKRLSQISGKRPDAVVDFRRLLDRADVDALVIATPDHWHAPITLHACVAGKDVYVEKPCSHNIREGRLAVNAARKYQRIVQHGTNLRAAPHYEQAWKLLREGVIGKLQMVKAINNQRRRRWESRPDEAAPDRVNYDLWLGPAPERPFNVNRFHHSWHWCWDYGTGDLGNDGIHQIDIGRWGGNLGLPRAVSCSGAKLASRGDAQETPDTMVVTWEYDELLYVYEQRDFAPYRLQGHQHDNDNLFFGEHGYLMIDRDGYRVFFKNEAGPSLFEPWVDTPVHYQNFIDAVKSRRSDQLLADIEVGHQSAVLCHLGNIAYRTGRRLVFDPDTETFPDDAQANQYLAREYRRGYELPQLVRL